MSCITEKLKGLTHPDTIRFSQELEIFILRYQLFFYE
ncbi:aspartyl-phosphate phosphatase Spo0E family protein [Heyndrickxia sp. NPDC080065]